MTHPVFHAMMRYSFTCAKRIGRCVLCEGDRRSAFNLPIDEAGHTGPAVYGSGRHCENPHLECDEILLEREYQKHNKTHFAEVEERFAEPI